MYRAVGWALALAHGTANGVGPHVGQLGCGGPCRWALGYGAANVRWNTGCPTAGIGSTRFAVVQLHIGLPSDNVAYVRPGSLCLPFRHITVALR